MYAWKDYVFLTEPTDEIPVPLCKYRNRIQSDEYCYIDPIRTLIIC
jgi:hypothetical protein